MGFRAFSSISNRQGSVKIQRLTAHGPAANIALIRYLASTANRPRIFRGDFPEPKSIEQHSDSIGGETAFRIGAGAGADGSSMVAFSSDLVLQRVGQSRQVGSLPAHQKPWSRPSRNPMRHLAGLPCDLARC